MWYTEGTVSVQTGSATVTGSPDVEFIHNSRIGDGFVGPDGLLYEVTNIPGDNLLAIRPDYKGPTVADAAYLLIPVQGYVKLAADRLLQITDGIDDISEDVAASASNAAIALAHKNAAAASAAAALTSKDAAAISAASALSSKNAAATSETNAASSQTAAAGSAAAALSSKNAAATSAGEAATSANAALQSRNAATTSETNAADSAAEALSSAGDAATSEANAANSAAAALSSKNAAATSETNAAASAGSALASKNAVDTARDATFVARDATFVARDEAVAAAGTITGVLSERGNIDLSSGSYPATPPEASFWKVTVAGTVGGVDYGVGDSLVYSKTSDSFYKIDNTESVTSVGGFQGVVTKSQLGIDQTFTAAEKTKLGGVATGATANDTDANLKSRANHTGTQLATTISDFAATVRSTVLTGLSTASSAVVAATDGVLAALGKLQAQLLERLPFSGGVMTGVVTFTTQVLPLKLKGAAAGASNAVYMAFYDSDDVRDGYLGVASPSNRDIYLTADAGNVRILPMAGHTQLFDGGAVKLETSSTGVLVIGTLVATQFQGGGAGLTGLDAGNVASGTLPVARGGTGGTTPAAARAGLELGTGALGTLAVSTMETNTGRILRIGDHGIGGTSLPGIAGTDIDALRSTGFYYASGSGSNQGSLPLASNGYLTSIVYASAYCKQTFSYVLGGREWTRICNNNVWEEWTETSHGMLWTNAAPVNSWVWDSAGDAADYYPPSYAKRDNTVYLRGKITKAAAVTANTTMFTLPVGYRPLKRKVFSCFFDASSPLFFGTCTIFVNTNGTVVIVALGAGSTSTSTDNHVLFDGIFFDIT